MVKIILKNYYIVIILILLATICAYLYSRILFSIKPDKIWDWYNSISSTLISVVLALAIAIGIFFFQTNIIQKAEKDKYLFVLDVELAATWQGVQNTENPLNVNYKNTTYSFNVVYLQSIILEEAARSGLFNEKETRLLLKLTRYINFHNMNLDLLISLIPRIDDPFSEQKINMSWKAHTKTRDMIINDIQNICNFISLPELTKRIKILPPKI
jgi:hypothetical protein